MSIHLVYASGGSCGTPFSYNSQQLVCTGLDYMSGSWLGGSEPQNAAGIDSYCQSNNVSKPW